VHKVHIWYYRRRIYKSIHSSLSASQFLKKTYWTAACFFAKLYFDTCITKLTLFVSSCVRNIYKLHKHLVYLYKMYNYLYIFIMVYSKLSYFLFYVNYYKLDSAYMTMFDIPSASSSKVIKSSRNICSRRELTCTK